MRQTRKASLVETLLSTAIGFGVSLVAQVVIFPWFGISVSLAADMAIGALFTVVSVARGFAVRRLFETLRVKGILP